MRHRLVFTNHGLEEIEYIEPMNAKEMAYEAEREWSMSLFRKNNPLRVIAEDDREQAEEMLTNLYDANNKLDINIASEYIELAMRNPNSNRCAAVAFAGLYSALNKEDRTDDKFEKIIDKIWTFPGVTNPTMTVDEEQPAVDSEAKKPNASNSTVKSKADAAIPEGADPKQVHQHVVQEATKKLDEIIDAAKHRGSEDNPVYTNKDVGEMLDKLNDPESGIYVQPVEQPQVQQPKRQTHHKSNKELLQQATGQQIDPQAQQQMNAAAHQFDATKFISNPQQQQPQMVGKPNYMNYLPHGQQTPPPTGQVVTPQQIMSQQPVTNTQQAPKPEFKPHIQNGIDLDKIPLKQLLDELRKNITFITGAHPAMDRSNLIALYTLVHNNNYLKTKLKEYKSKCRPNNPQLREVPVSTKGGFDFAFEVERQVKGADPIMILFNSNTTKSQDGSVEGNLVSIYLKNEKQAPITEPVVDAEVKSEEVVEEDKPDTVQQSQHLSRKQKKQLQRNKGKK